MEVCFLVMNLNIVTGVMKRTFLLWKLLNVVQWYWHSKKLRMLLRLFTLFNLFISYFAIMQAFFVTDITIIAITSITCITLCGHTDGSSIGRVFRPPLWRWRKMAALPLPVAILDDLISRKWGHPRWRPEAEGPPFSSTSTIGVEKLSPSLGWRHFRRRHLGIEMAAPHLTSGGRRNSREILRKGSS